jgi:hypothetical protein
LLAIDPQNKLVEPVSNWLIKNRRGAQWSNTRDTAIAVLALNDYLRVIGEVSPEIEYELLVNGQSIVNKTVTRTDVFQTPSQYVIPTTAIRDSNEVRIVRRKGSGPIYFAASAQYYSLEEPITPAGNEIFVRRQYYKLIAHPTLLKGFVYERTPLNNGESLKSGDRVQTVLTIEAKNDYEYLVFEDLKRRFGGSRIEERRVLGSSRAKVRRCRTPIRRRNQWRCSTSPAAAKFRAGSQVPKHRRAAGNNSEPAAGS